jgi:hypothetical protein
VGDDRACVRYVADREAKGCLSVVEVANDRIEEKVCEVE